MVSTSQGFSYDQHSAQLSFKLPGGALSSPAQTHFVLISPRNFCLKTRDFTEWLPAAFKGGGWDPRPTTALFWGRNKAAPRALRHPEMKSPLVSGGRCCPPPPPAPSCGRQGSPCLFTAGGERADIVWTGAGRGGCGRKNGRRQPSRSSRGGKSQVSENQKSFPQTVPISHTLFFFF